MQGARPQLLATDKAPFSTAVMAVDLLRGLRAVSKTSSACSGRPLLILGFYPLAQKSIAPSGLSPQPPEGICRRIAGVNPVRSRPTLLVATKDGVKQGGIKLDEPKPSEKKACGKVCKRIRGAIYPRISV